MDEQQARNLEERLRYLEETVFGAHGTNGIHGNVRLLGRVFYGDPERGIDGALPRLRAVEKQAKRCVESESRLAALDGSVTSLQKLRSRDVSWGIRFLAAFWVISTFVNFFGWQAQDVAAFLARLLF